ncbi:MAG TPA: molybdate ABC transporter substrate-binding protein [Longimicrobium sp.]|nr:molybdate ABC transporter substrate-binding protein [Longimicrobium sp.]
MRPTDRSRLAIPLAFFFALLPAACRDRGREAEAPRVVLTVAAAASLREAMGELEAAYEAENRGVDVRTTFGASGLLRQQVEQGAPVDVFVSAAEGPIDALQAAGLVDPRSRRVLAGNELVLVVPQGSTAPVRGFGDLDAPEVRRVALGAPASVPAGEYADEVLRALGIREAVARKAVYGQNVRQVLAYVESGDADAGVVYRTDAAVSRRVRLVASAPPGTHGPITYPVAVVRRTRAPEAARAYVAFLLGPEGRAVLRRRGFRVDG